MHVLQWIAVKDSDVDSAAGQVEDYLNNALDGNWYDWFVVGGGRWNSEQDQYANSTNMVIDFEKDGLTKFEERIGICIEARLREFNDYRKSLENVDINASLDKYDGLTDYSFELYSLGKCIDMLNGNWDFNSYFFDVEHGSTNTKHMLDNIAKGSVDWYLVPVDFHF